MYRQPVSIKSISVQLNRPIKRINENKTIKDFHVLIQQILRCIGHTQSFLSNLYCRLFCVTCQTIKNV